MSTTSLLVYDYPENAEVSKALGVYPNRNSVVCASGSFTLATFDNQDKARKALKTLESQSDKVFSVEYAHANDIAKNFGRSLYVRLPSIDTDLKPLFILWDWENIPIPGYYAVKDLYQTIVAFLRREGFFVAGFVGYGDVRRMNNKKYDYLLQHHSKDIELFHFPTSSDKDVADQKIKVALLQYLCDKHPPAPTLVMTGDQDFSVLMKFLRNKGFEIYLAYNDEAQQEIKDSATKHWHYYKVFGVANPGGKKKKKKSQRKIAKDAIWREKRIAEGKAEQAITGVQAHEEVGSSTHEEVAEKEGKGRKRKEEEQGGGESKRSGKRKKKT